MPHSSVGGSELSGRIYQLYRSALYSRWKLKSNYYPSFELLTVTIRLVSAPQDELLFELAAEL